MEKRNLGNSELKTAPLIFGGNVFGWTIDEKTSFAVLDAFIDEGFNCIDTADVYSAWVPGNQGGESESILGRWMAARKNRDKVIIATKVGMEVQGRKGLSSSNITSAFEKSLQRLQTDYVDLYQAHAQDNDVNIEETLKSFDKIQSSGKAKVIGASNYDGKSLKNALETAKKIQVEGYKTLQPGYNLFDRQDYESNLEGFCTENNLSVITYYSLASGFLTGKYRQDSDTKVSQRGQSVKSKYMNERGFKILKALDEVSEELRGTPAQVALAWLIHRPSVTAPIVSATSVLQVQDIAKSARLKLTAEMINKLNVASDWK